MNVSGKVAIVTGASSGIGMATAKLLSQKGASVALVARSVDKLKNLQKELPNSYVVQTDMTKKKDIVAMVKNVHKHYGRIDILVNNAGRGYDSPIEKIDMKKFGQLCDLNLIGPILALQEVIPIMRRQSRGAIVNISSGTSFMAIPQIGAYSSLKRALNGMSLTAREELKNDNIIVSVIYPYITNTAFYKNKLSNTPLVDEKMYLSGDKAEHVADKILEAIQSGEAQVYAREEMKKLH